MIGCGHRPMIKSPHVTEAIGPWTAAAFAKIPPDTLLAAQDRGTAFHALAAAYALGLWIPEVDPGLQGYFDSFRRWFDKFVTKTISVEEAYQHPTLYYEGTPDWVGILVGDQDVITLVDWKTPAFASKSWRLQLAAYRGLVEKRGLPIGRVASLQPRKDGKTAKFLEYTESLTRDMAVFMSVLQVWRFFNDN